MIIIRELKRLSFLFTLKLSIMSMRKLKEELDDLKYELYDLHHIEPNPTMYVQKRDELEYKIACLEERIEMEQKLNPFRIMLFGFIIIACGIVLWTYVAKH
jgi:hypothetical protein